MERNDFLMQRPDFQAELCWHSGSDWLQPQELKPIIRAVVDTVLNVGNGKCAVNQTDPSLPRERQWYLDNVIAPMIERGEIGDGMRTKFDDRKLRYDGATVIVEGKIGDYREFLIDLGITHYKAFLADINRSDEDNMKLQERGMKEFNDRYAFFARAPGVAVLPINEDGTIYIGERTNAEYGGFLNAVAGHLTYKQNVEDVDISEEAFRELAEEFGIKRDEVKNLEFAGVYSHPIKGDLDFTFIAKVKQPEKYFSSGDWMKNVKEREHKPLVRLATMDEISDLLENGKVPDSDRTLKVMYSTRGALMSIRPEEIRN